MGGTKTLQQSAHYDTCTKNDYKEGHVDVEVWEQIPSVVIPTPYNLPNQPKQATFKNACNNFKYIKMTFRAVNLKLQVWFGDLGT